MHRWREANNAARCAAQPLFRAGRLLSRWRARAPFAQLRLFGCQGLVCAGHGTQYGFRHIGHDVKLTDLMRHLPEHLQEGLGIERRAIGRDA